MTRRREDRVLPGRWRHYPRKTHRSIGFPLIITAILLAGLLAFWIWAKETDRIEQWLAGLNSPVVKEIDVMGINSPYAIMIQSRGGSSLCESRPDERIYPASMTKIMTALLAIETIKNLDKEITLTEESFAGLYEADAMQAGFEPGERVRILDLLYGALLASGAECCRALAIEAAGSEDDFALLMNKKAARLGMGDSHFVNTSGLHDPDHYSTVRDMAVLLKYAVYNHTFRDIIESDSHFVPPTNLHPDGMMIYSVLFRYLQDPSVTGGKILGGKTGYTSEAGQCLASYAEIEGRRYILVTAGAIQNGYPLHVYDAQTLFSRVGEEAWRMRGEE